MVEKYVREDGKIAVLVSAGYGAGWSTWNTVDEELAEALLFDADVVKMVLEDREDEIEAFVTAKYKDKTDDGWNYLVTAGAKDLYVEWVNKGERFVIDEYDGAEHLVRETETYWYEA